MPTVGDPLPAFALKAAVSVESGHELALVSRESFPGEWLVLFFWPIDFTAICPTEILEFARHAADFEVRSARALGVLDALRTGKLTPCEWRPGEATLLAW